MEKEDTYVCSVCGKQVTRSKKTGNMGKLCNTCRQHYRQLKLKRKAIDYLGGKCIMCGYDKCTAVLEFHHRIPEDKSFTISTNLNKSWNSLKVELDKCDLLCANCHRELHYNNSERTSDISEYEKFIDVGFCNTHKLADEKQNNIEKHKDLRNCINKDRIRIVNSCNLDFSSSGWITELSKLFGISPNGAKKWLVVNMPQLYDSCFKVKKQTADDIVDIINLYKDGKSIENIAVLKSSCPETISKILHKNNIDPMKYNQKHIGMYSLDGTFIADFNSLHNAAEYVVNNIISRGGVVKLENAVTKLRNCVNGKQATSYKHIWKEIK